MKVIWSGTEEGQDAWTVYSSSHRNNVRTINHNLNIPIELKGVRIKFREFATEKPVLGSGNFILNDETSRKFQITNITPNSLTIEFFARIPDSIEYQIELLKEFDDPTLILTTGNSVDSQGMDIEYTIDWNDGSDLVWSLEPKQSHTYISSHTYIKTGIYRVRAKSRASGIESAWTEPKIIEVFNKSILVYTPKIESGSSKLKVMAVGIFFLDRTSLGSTRGESIQSRFDWGDYTYSDWSEDIYASHAWTKEGSYEVKAQSRIIESSEVSNWSASFPVVVSNIVIIEPTDILEYPEYLITPSPVITSTKVLINSLVTVDTEKILLPPNKKPQFKFDFGDGMSTDWSDKPTTTHRWIMTGSMKVLCRMRIKDELYQSLGWIECDWSSPTSIIVLDRIITIPDIPSGISEVLSKPAGIITTNPAGELNIGTFERKWQSDWIRITKLGIQEIIHQLGEVPYLINFSFDLEGDPDERAYEDSYRIVTDETGLDVTVLYSYPITENSFYINVHRYIESVNSRTGSNVKIIVSRFKVLLRS